MLIKATISFIH